MIPKSFTRNSEGDSSGKPEFLLQSSFLLFVFFGLTQELDDLFRIFFFAGMLPATLYLVFKKKALKTSLTSCSLLSAYGLITILYLSVYWSETKDPAEEIARHTRWFIETLIFFTAMHLYGKSGLHRKKAHGYTIQAALISGTLIAILFYILESQYPARITGFGLLDDIIASSSVLVMLWVVSLTSLQVEQKKDLFIAIMALILITAYALLNQSRAPLGMAVLAWLSFTIMYSRSIKYLLVPILLLGVGLTYLLDLSVLFDRMINRGSSYRLEIWGATLDNIGAFFWTGVGAASSVADTSIGAAIEQAMGVRHDHPHNLFLSTWVDGGIFAFTMIMLLFATLVFKAFTRNHQERNLALWMLVTVAGLCFTDPDTLVTSPQEIYLVFWTPIGLLSGMLHGKIQRQKCS
ncbi:O-antigen ligase family protein [Marinobacter sp.]|uniref:O-antigen ligase family protein n=1 Tax=Marinobacter sp. TaxID=50741 RepID=UPI003A93FEB6